MLLESLSVHLPAHHLSASFRILVAVISGSTSYVTAKELKLPGPKTALPKTRSPPLYSVVEEIMWSSDSNGRKILISY